MFARQKTQTTASTTAAATTAACRSGRTAVLSPPAVASEPQFQHTKASVQGGFTLVASNGQVAAVMPVSSARREALAVSKPQPVLRRPHIGQDNKPYYERLALAAARARETAATMADDVTGGGSLPVAAQHDGSLSHTADKPVRQPRMRLVVPVSTSPATRRGAGRLR